MGRTSTTQLAAIETSEAACAYRQYGALVLRRCRRILRHEQTAQDATQEVFFRLLRYGRSYREADSQIGWLYRVAERCCLNELRRRRGDGQLLDEPAQAHDPRHPSQPENREVVTRFLGRFETRVREVAVMHFVEEMTQDEIAAHTGWSRQTVHKKLQLVRKRAAAWRLRLLGSPQ
jgi:RNA polymerase sigma-70 factor (ECF subfamily)